MEKNILREILLEETVLKDVIIRPLHGDRTLLENYGVFSVAFSNNMMGKTGVFTPQTSVKVYEVIEEATLEEIFSFLSGPWNKKWFSQDQICEICGRFLNLLKDDACPNLFLAKKNEGGPVNENLPEDNLFVVCVEIFSNGLCVTDSYELNYDYKFPGTSAIRIFSPSPIFRKKIF